MGPAGMFRRMGIDPLRASPAELTTALSPMFSNQSAANIASMIVNQRADWLNQIRNALRLNLTLEAQEKAQRDSLWYGLVAARSQMMNALGTIAEAFKFILLPPIQLVASGLQNLAALVSPQTGNPFARTGLVAGGLLGGFFLLRTLARGMGPIGRLLLGGGLGLAFGGITEALMGALLLRGMGNAATAVAATAVGMTLGRRILAGLLAIWRGIPKFLLISALIGGIGAIADNWEAVKPRILAVWEDLNRALPSWLGGQGQGPSALTQGPGLARIGQDIDTFTRPISESLENWLLGTQIGRWLYDRGIMQTMRDYDLGRLARDAERTAQMGFYPAAPQDLSRAVGKPGTVGSITTGPITVTVNVTQPTNADPQTIGDAAGNAVRSRLRQLLTDGATLTE